jgi:hypothetical protein
MKKEKAGDFRLTGPLRFLRAASILEPLKVQGRKVLPALSRKSHSIIVVSS